MDISQEVAKLRNEGLTDNLISEELQDQGFPEDQIAGALGGGSMPVEMPAGTDDSMFPPPPGMGGGMSSMGGGSSMPVSTAQGNIYERVEEIAEGIIDQKWDELMGEVKKIVQWKNKTEEKFTQLSIDVSKLKEDFKILHQGVLGKLDDYDKRMGDVGNELKAVGKVFKDVIPEFVENVKELSHITGKHKKKKEE